MRDIYYSEKYHFTGKRVFFLLVNFAVLIVTQFVYKNEDLSPAVRYSTAAVFALLMIGMTVSSVKEVHKIHATKHQLGYKFDEQDYLFHSMGEIAKLAVFCMIAAILCGATGIAGGMVLGPLFLTYNMQPLVMSSTNQFITLVASLAVASQFAYLGVIYWGYAAIYGAITLVAAWIGI